MTMTLQQLRDQLSAIEPDENIYDNITVNEISLLEQLLRESETWLAARAVFALSRLRDAKAENLLAKATEDMRVEVRVAVAASARNLPSATSNKLLSKLLGDGDSGVRKFSIQSISYESDMYLREKLQWMARQDTTYFIRKTAREKLLEFKLAVFEELDLKHNDPTTYIYEGTYHAAPQPKAIVTRVKKRSRRKMRLIHEGREFLFDPKNNPEGVTQAFNGLKLEGNWRASIESSLPPWHLYASIPIDIEWEEM